MSPFSFTKCSAAFLLGLALSAAASSPQDFQLDHQLSRTAFYKLEQGAVLKLRLRSQGEAVPGGLTLRVSGPGPQVQEIPIAALKAGEQKTLSVPWNASLKPGRYPVKVESFDQEGKPLAAALAFEVTIVPRPSPDELPVIMWGHTRGKGIHELKSLGFTHFIGLWQGSTSPVPEFLPPRAVEKTRREIDVAFAAGLRSVGRISLGHAREFVKRHPRKDRKGQPVPALNPLLPEVQEAAAKLGEFVRREFDDLTPLEGVLVNTEERDHTRPSFDDVDRAAYREATGAEIPSLGGDLARGVSYQQLSAFPKRRVVPSDHPVLQYYRWFWKEGDGWNRLNTLTAAPLRKGGRFWTWNDPAVRAPSVYRTDGEMNFYGQWTYTYPDPLKIELAANDLCTMAEGSEGVAPMKMTQVIWYRSQTAPLPRGGAAPLRGRAAWEERFPESRFITIAPDHLSESLWLKLSEPIRGIMYHGLGSLLPPEEGKVLSPRAYGSTCPETGQRFRTLMETVVQPLGPVLRKLPATPGKVAFLQSFTSQIFAERGTYGWGNGWGADAYLATRYAGLTPKIVYEETLLREGLDRYQVLLLPHCDVLTREMVDSILAFQKRGGILIGDEFLCPEIQPDLLMLSYRREHEARADKAALLSLAKKLRTELAPYYHEPAQSVSPDLLLKRRGAEGNYLVAVNDRRTYGDYVGAHRLVMEKGEELETEVIWDTPRRVIYDLMRQKRVALQPTESGVRFGLKLGGGEGTLLVALAEPLEKVAVHPQRETVAPGGVMEVDIEVRDASGSPARAVLPVKVTIRDPEGEIAEQSGFRATENGRLRLRIDVAANDLKGKWRITAQEGASGLTGSATFKVE